MTAKRAHKRIGKRDGGSDTVGRWAEGIDYMDASSDE